MSEGNSDTAPTDFEYGYEIPCKIIIHQEGESIYEKTFIEFNDTTFEMERKLKITMAKFNEAIAGFNKAHHRETYDFFSVEYRILDNWRVIYAYFMDDDDANSKYLWDFITAIGNSDQSKISLLFKQRIKNNPQAIDDMVKNSFRAKHEDFDDMIKGYKLLFEAK